MSVTPALAASIVCVQPRASRSVRITSPEWNTPLLYDITYISINHWHEFANNDGPFVHTV